MAKNKYVWIFVSQSIAKCIRSAFRLRGKAGPTPPGSTMIPLMTMSFNPATTTLVRLRDAKLPQSITRQRHLVRRHEKQGMKDQDHEVKLIIGQWCARLG